MRVRQKAQFALVDRTASAVIEEVAQSPDHQLARVHALWGLTQLVRLGKVQGSVLMPFLTDTDPEIRAQACRLLGDIRWVKAGTELLPLLDDSEARIRFFAAEALGRMAEKSAVAPIIRMLEKNGDQDAYLRHAGCLALARIGLAERIIDLAKHPSRALRIAAVVTLRKLQHPSLALFLADEDEFIVTEAARAINDDLSVEEVLPQLGQMLAQSRFENEALIRRAINANLRVGTMQSMKLLIDFALDNKRDLSMRLEALMALSTWIHPSVVDRVDGRYRGKIERDPYEVRNTASASLTLLLKDPDYTIRIQAIRTCAKLGATAVTGAIVDAMTNDKNAEVRSAGLEALVTLDQIQAQTAIKTILAKEEEPVRVTALQQLKALSIDPSEIAVSLNNILTGGTSQEKQAALAALVNLPKESIVDQLSLMLDELLAGNVDEALQLDLLDVALNNGDESVLKKIEIFRKKYAELGMAANYIECMEGGDSRAGRGVLINNSAAQCLKCHAISGYGGVAGPPLDNVGARRDRLFLLQSLVEPSAHLAPWLRSGNCHLEK
ncbi:MAG: HEAT repeat domain-containing protein [Saprospiraceae bacterium]|nr:HEAT repeat domain-containing protein [Saprospiraceae bacterium]